MAAPLREFAPPASEPPLAGADALHDELLEPRGRKPYPPKVQWLRDRLFLLFLLLVWTSLGGAAVSYAWVQDWEQCQVASIPLVSLAFTWWHVWLGIQMCFYPLEFVGKPPFLGWQGIIPRRARVMAERACAVMLGKLITIEEIIDRLDPADTARQCGQVFLAVSGEVLDQVGEKHWPTLWAQLPAAVKAELAERCAEDAERVMGPLISDVKQVWAEVFDLTQMCVELLEADRVLLVNMFQELGEKEFKFIEHFAAVMGFVCGLLQLLVYAATSGWPSTARFCVLPFSGLAIGYFTNWAAISLIFRPVDPHIFCCGYLNFQGVFLKRQHVVAGQLAKLICTQLVHTKNMVRFLQKSPGYAEVKAIYARRCGAALESAVGSARKALPVVGIDFDAVVDDALDEVLLALPSHGDPLAQYADRVFDVESTMRDRLRKLPPGEFEQILHPIFEQDEWMILVLGGVLGVAVGSVQSLALGI